MNGGRYNDEEKFKELEKSTTELKKEYYFGKSDLFCTLKCDKMEDFHRSCAFRKSRINEVGRLRNKDCPYTVKEVCDSLLPIYRIKNSIKESVW